MATGRLLTRTALPRRSSEAIKEAIKGHPSRQARFAIALSNRGLVSYQIIADQRLRPHGAVEKGGLPRCPAPRSPEKRNPCGGLTVLRNTCPPRINLRYSCVYRVGS
jgi:hypothetical protein